MTIDERIAFATGEMNVLQQQMESVEKQIAQLQQQRESIILMHNRHQGALTVLQEMKAEMPAEITE